MLDTWACLFFCTTYVAMSLKAFKSVSVAWVLVGYSKHQYHDSCRHVGMGAWSHKRFTSASLRGVIDRKLFVQLKGFYGNNTWLSIKANFLYWRILLNCIPSRVSLAIRGILIIATTCPLCNCYDRMFITSLLTVNLHVKYGLIWAFGWSYLLLHLVHLKP